MGDDNSSILSDEDYNKIARDVKSLKGNGKDDDLNLVFGSPRKENIMPDAPREQRIELTERKPPEPQKPRECIFCMIAKKVVSSRVVSENDDFVAILDIQPKSVGHVVIISKRHVAEIVDLDIAEQNSLNDVLRGICMKMKGKLKATGYNIISSNGISAGQTIPHFSMHIIPTYSSNSVELPVMSIIQSQRTPDFVMDDVMNKFSAASGGAKDAKKDDSSWQGFKS